MYLRNLVHQVGLFSTSLGKMHGLQNIKNQYIYFWSYTAQFFLEREIFRTKVVEEIKNTHFVFKNIFSKIVPFMSERRKIP
jgi:hypothetical protein